MKAKKLLALLLCAVLALGLVACGESGGTNDSGSAASSSGSSDSGSSGGTSDAAGKKVGVAMPTKSLERWNRDGSYLEEKFKEKGFEVSLVFSDNKIDQQVKDIEGLIADGVNLLVVAAIDGEDRKSVV